ncbi:hypothetical protein [Ruegeria sp. HKCCA4707]|uniref:hypothetical protein n=1 Tax=Ruegeria sp. HKCCA4707 TaxID=2682984 RepID=UPI0014876A74|nr:hypothetical protein [Ruegeria sp. HKCCA4707]
MWRFVSLLLLMLSASPALPGPWLREKDSAFTAASVTAFKDGDYGYDYKSALYAEWGYKDNLTLGFDFEENRDLYGHATVFARLPLASLGEKGRFAAEFGVGVHHRHKGAWALYKATLSYGKGFQTGWGNGWVAVDTTLEYRTHNALIRKLDLTAGLKSRRWVDPLLQVETAYRSGDDLYWRVRPSVMVRNPDSPTTWVLGFERNDARDNTGIKVAIWGEF